MCTPKEIREALEDNNKVRDEKWEYRFKILTDHIKDITVNKSDLGLVTNNCAARGVELKNNMEKLDSIEKKLDKVLEEKADKIEVNKLEKFVSKVMWLSATSLIGFLVTVVWYLIDNMSK